MSLLGQILDQSVQPLDGSDLVLDQSDLVLDAGRGVVLTLYVLRLRGFISGAGVQTDGSETFHPLPDRDQRPEAAVGAAQVSAHTFTCICAHLDTPGIIYPVSSISCV